VHLDNPPGDRKPETGAALVLGDRAVGLLELLEQLALVGRGNAGAGVGDCDAKRAVGEACGHVHLARVGELDGVADQVEQDLGEAVLVAASARQIRSLLLQGKSCSEWMPESAWEILSCETAEGRSPADLRFAERAILAKLRCLSRAEFSELPDLSEGLENRIFSALQKASTLEELYALAKTKRYPLARIRRIVLSAFLGLKACHGAGLPPYLRVLGINGESGAQLLKQAAGKTDLPILTRSADFSGLKGTAKTIGDLENRSSDLYALCMPKVMPCGSDRTSGVVVL